MHSCTLGVCRVTCNRLCRYVSRKNARAFVNYFFSRKKKKKKTGTDNFLDAIVVPGRKKKKKNIKCKSAASREREKEYIKVQYSAKASD